MGRGNADKVMAAADEIARRLKAGEATIRGLQKEYHCSYEVMMRAVFSRMSRRTWARVRRRIKANAVSPSRFRKGLVPWNKGLKGVHLSPVTEFKKGHGPVNHRPVGTIVIRGKSGKKYRFIKIADTGRPDDWIYYARHVWAAAHGPIPKGLCVVHADGNTLNDDLANLRLVDRAGHLALQQARKPAMVAKARRRAAAAAKQRHIQTRLAKLRAAKAAQEGPERWECIGCGLDYRKEPTGVCRKCNGVRFARIGQVA